MNRKHGNVNGFEPCPTPEKERKRRRSGLCKRRGVCRVFCCCKERNTVCRIGCQSLAGFPPASARSLRRRHGCRSAVCTRRTHTASKHGVPPCGRTRLPRALCRRREVLRTLFAGRAWRTDRSDTWNSLRNNPRVCPAFSAQSLPLRSPPRRARNHDYHYI